MALGGVNFTKKCPQSVIRSVALIAKDLTADGLLTDCFDPSVRATERREKNPNFWASETSEQTRVKCGEDCFGRHFRSERFQTVRHFLRQF
jgi:hypothetical protein